MLSYQHNICRENIITLLLGLTLFVINLEYSAFNLMLKPLSQQFALPINAMQWLITAYTLSWGLSLFFVAYLADLWGKKRVFILGSLLFSLATLFAALSHHFAWIITVRILQGIAAAVLSTTSIALLLSQVRQTRKNFLLGRVIAGFAAGQALGPLIGAMFLNIYWRIIFWLSIPLILGIAAGIRYLIKDKQPHRAKLNLKGALLISATFFFSIISFITFPFLQVNFFSRTLFLLVSLGFFHFYLHAASTYKNPILPIDCLTNKNYMLATVLRVLFNFIYTGFFFLFALLLQSFYHLSSMQAATILGFLSLFMALASPLSGYLADRFHLARTLCLGFFLIFLGLLFFSQMELLTLMIGFAFFIAVGFGFCNPLITTLLLKQVDPNYITRAYSFNAVLAIIASSLSIYFTSNLLLFENFEALKNIYSLSVSQIQELHFFLSQLEFDKVTALLMKKTYLDQFLPSILAAGFKSNLFIYTLLSSIAMGVSLYLLSREKI